MTTNINGLASVTSLNVGSTIAITGVLDEDNMASDSAVKLCTQQSIKAFAESLAFDPENINIADNTSEAFNVEEGANHYINVDTTTGSEVITLGSVAKDPDFLLLGDGLFSVKVAQLDFVDIRGNLKITGAANKVPVATVVLARAAQEDMSANCFFQASPTLTNRYVSFSDLIVGQVIMVYNNSATYGLKVDIDPIGQSTARVVEIPLGQGAMFRYSAAGFTELQCLSALPLTT